MDLVAHVGQVLDQDCGLKARTQLIVGVSGGPDSMALMDLLVRMDYAPIIGHLDHSLRPESSEEAQFVKREAERRGLSYFGQRTDVAHLAERSKLNLEEAARAARYGFLFTLAEQRQAEAVLVAHQADDQAETMLMHLIRGAGPMGLAGMKLYLRPNPWSKDIALVRPMLQVSREEIEAWCRQNEIPYADDESNRDRKLLRNALRHDLIPAIERHNPNFRTALLRTQAILAEEHDLLTDLGRQAWQKVLTSQGQRVLRLSKTTWHHTPLAIQRRLVRQVFEHFGAEASKLNFAATDQLIVWSRKARTNERLAWIAGIEVLAEGEALIFQRGEEAGVEGPQMRSPIRITATRSQDLEIGAGWRLGIAVSDRSTSNKSADPENYAVTCDLSPIRDLELRPRLSGDRFQPLGMQSGSMKIADYMINEKIPKRARANWPLLVSGDQVLWVPGFQLAEAIRVRPDSQIIHKLTFSREGI